MVQTIPKTAVTACAAITAVAAIGAMTWLGSKALAQQSAAATRLGAAVYGPNGQLPFPAGTDRWIAAGSALGGQYSDEPFDPARPGTIGEVKIEPSAYDYFLEHGEYADGTMFLLTFYASEAKSDPQLSGFVQGNVLQREIHVVDRERFAEEGHAFYLYPAGATADPMPLPVGSECFRCHSEHGAFDATFVQFYPALRDLH